MCDAMPNGAGVGKLEWIGLEYGAVYVCVYNMIQDVSICHFAKLTNIHIQRRTYQLSRSTALDI